MVRDGVTNSAQNRDCVAVTRDEVTNSAQNCVAVARDEVTNSAQNRVPIVRDEVTNSAQNSNALVVRDKVTNSAQDNINCVRKQDSSNAQNRPNVFLEEENESQRVQSKLLSTKNFLKQDSNSVQNTSVFVIGGTESERVQTKVPKGVIEIIPHSYRKEKVCTVQPLQPIPNKGEPPLILAPLRQCLTSGTRILCKLLLPSFSTPTCASFL